MCRRREKREERGEERTGATVTTRSRGKRVKEGKERGGEEERIRRRR